jgi:hypothetical protein
MGMIVVMRVRVRHLEKSLCFGGSTAGVIALAEANTITAPFANAVMNCVRTTYREDLPQLVRELMD